MAEILETSKMECTGFLDVFDSQLLWGGEERADCPDEWKDMLVGLTSTQLLSLENGHNRSLPFHQAQVQAADARQGMVSAADNSEEDTSSKSTQEKRDAQAPSDRNTRRGEERLEGNLRG